MTMTRTPLISLTLIAATVAAAPTPARADDDPTDFEVSELYDGDAIAFVYAPAALAVGLHLWAQPPERPRLFSFDEGGAPSRRDYEIPGWTVGAAAAATFGGLIASGDDSRWYHAKGLAQSLATSAALTEIAKNVFGRHRPDWTPDDHSPITRRSFFSGHSSQTLVVATYLGLFLREHGYDGVRGDATLPWWEAATYVGLAGVAFYIPYTRVRDNRHHLSDVIVGGLTGAAIATAFFYWREHELDENVDQAMQSRRDPGYSPTVPVLHLGFTF